MLSKKPWDFEPDLTLERLQWLAVTFASVRKVARTAHEPSKGDGPWGFGCRCYERQMHAITAAAQDGEHPWLKIVQSPPQFIFSIGSVPARFYRGDHEHPRESMRETFSILRQRTLAFPIMDDAKNFAWCFAIETDADGLVSGVWAAAFSVGEELIYRYEIPFAGEQKSPIVSLAPPPVPIAPPTVSAPASIKKISDTDEP